MQAEIERVLLKRIEYWETVRDVASTELIFITELNLTQKLCTAA